MTATTDTRYSVYRFGWVIIEYRRNLSLTDAETLAQSRSLWQHALFVVMTPDRQIVASFDDGKRVSA